MNYLEEQMDGKAMIYSIQNGDHPLPIVAQVSLARTALNAIPTLKDPKFWTAEGKKTRKIDHLSSMESGTWQAIESQKPFIILWSYCNFRRRLKQLKVKSLQLQKTNLITELGNELYFGRIAKYDSESHRHYVEYKDGDEKLVTLSKEIIKFHVSLEEIKCLRLTCDLHCFETDYLDVNEMILLTANLDDCHDIEPRDIIWDKLTEKDSVSITGVARSFPGSYPQRGLNTNKKTEFVKSIEKKEDKRADEKKRAMSKVKCYNCKKEVHFSKDYKKQSENFIENHIDSQKYCDESEVDHNDSEAKDNLIDKLIQKFNHKIAKCQKRIKKEKNNEFHEQMKVLNEKNTDLLAQTEVLKKQLKVKHVVIDTHAECQAQYVKLKEEQYEYMIRYSALCDNDKQHRKKIDEQKILFDKMSRQLVKMNNKVLRLQENILEKETKISKLEGCVSNKDLEIKKCLDRLNDYENKLHKIKQTNQMIHMIMPSKDNLYNGRKGIGFENPSYFEKAKDLRHSLYDEKVIGLGYTLMFLTHSNEALEIEKFKRARENKIEFAYDYGNLNASYVNEKINFSNDYFQEIINPDFEKIDYPFQQTSSLKPYVPNVILEKIIIDLEDEVVSLLEKEKANLETIESLKSKEFESGENAISELENKSENDCQVFEKECDNVENSKVFAPGMFKLNVSQSVSPTSMSKTSCASKNVETKTKRKGRKRKSSKQNDKQVNNDVLHANRDFVHFSDLDTFSSVRRPKHSGVIWKKKGPSNTSNVDLSSISHLKLNKDVKRYSCKDLLSCNNSHLGETSSVFVCNDSMNVSCKSRLDDSFDENNLFIFDGESVRNYPFRKNPRDFLNVHSKGNSNKSLPRTVHRWLSKKQPLVEPIVQICLWIINSRCSKHMTGNRALLTNFVEKFLRMVRFGNNDFVVIAGYGDVVVRSMTIKKVYYVKGLGHNLFSVRQFCDKGLKVAFRKSTCFVRNEDGVDLLTDDHSSNLNTIILNEVVSNSLTCLLAKASSSQSWLWHQHDNNSIKSIPKKDKLNGSNFLDWYRNMRIILGHEQKLHHLEEALPEAPHATATAAVLYAYTRRVAEQQELACLILDYDQFVQNYNMHGMGKTIPVEKGMLKKAPAVLAIRQGHIQKPKPQARGKGKNKGKSKLAYDPMHKIPLLAKKEHPAKDIECHHCHKLGY
nr:histone-lysine N-methyltransferase ATX2-like isoform X1 [Tanacetum cinerariifolium]